MTTIGMTQDPFDALALDKETVLTAFLENVLDFVCADLCEEEGW
jgi:hypothetical protein